MTEKIYVHVVDLIFAFPIILPIVTYVIPIIIGIQLSKKLGYIVPSILTVIVALVFLFADNWNIGFVGLAINTFVHWAIILYLCVIIKNIIIKIYDKHLDTIKAIK